MGEKNVFAYFLHVGSRPGASHDSSKGPAMDFGGRFTGNLGVLEEM